MIGHFGPIALVYPDGSPAIAADYKVLNDDGTTAALFTSQSGSTAKPNPTEADGLGQIEFYAETGAYEIVMLDTNHTMTVVVYPTEVGSSSEYVHTQAVAAGSWNITHNLGKFPSVVLVLNSAPDESVVTDVHYTSEDTLIVEWPSPESGKAYLN